MSLALRKPNPAEEVDNALHEPPVARDEPFDHDDGLLAVAGPIMLLSYTLLFAIAAVTFIWSGAALFAVAISIAFAVIYFAIPILLLRIRSARDRRWLRDERATHPVVEVLTGSMQRWEAIVQMVSIPLAILMGFALLAIRWAML